MNDINEKDNVKLSPYDRLQSILSEKNAGKLTNNASEKLDFLLDTKPSLFKRIYDSIKNFFNKVDRFIFSPRDRIGSVYSKRKKVDGKWT